MGGLNTFGYVSGNPINRFDFYGLAEICNTGIPFSFGIPHTFLCLNGVCGGKHGIGAPSFYNPGSEVRDDSADLPNASCSNVPEHDCDPISFNNCIQKKLKPRRLNKIYFFSGANCGSWVREEVSDCWKTCKKKKP